MESAYRMTPPGLTAKLIWHNKKYYPYQWNRL